MTKPTPFEQMLDADTNLVTQDMQGPGLPVVLVAQDGKKHDCAVVDGVELAMRGYFDRAGTDVTPGTSHAPVMSTAPMLHIQVSLVQAAIGRPLSRRDGFIVRGKSYRVEQPLPDGFGMISCKLLETGDAS